ncbi:putative membrane protein YphA (DoxX/SURF4 family) [Caulobacter ginsengisoli]|uniref:Membrane protein YphA (DoxX/SURF4 family) n=1 Tax=Caulobacter ginsengisoli TaxID=400775 RepID=A0ABU0IPF7_9CAUL|nr:DoxX family membrane protein [Caulobacter ginsengisoli]MDQ0463887.1 putative membrane protein YphA (DoxX/SURF4 family) [Caulobacter ginsengisoli]
MNRYLKYVPDLMAIFMAVIFLDSLFFKFTDDPKTIQIFTIRLDGWASSLNLPGLFGHTGLFSQYVIGSIELLASVLLLVGLLPRYKHLQAAGALAGLLVMMGAVSFHLFTPLGIDPNNDGAGLFIAACTNLVFAALLLGFFRRAAFLEFVGRVLAIFKPS